MLRLSPGDWLLFCSDGFIEDRNAQGEAVGYDGFLRRLEQLSAGRSTPGGGAALIDALFDSQTVLLASTDPITADDRTIVLIEAERATQNAQREG
jgi:serine phosphatase RsbU (regulator of sigma subunit)